MARADLEGNEFSLESRKKDLLPTLSAHYSYAHRPDASFFTLDDQFVYGFTAEQPLYSGKSLITSVKQAELISENSLFFIEQTINNLAFEVYGRYFELLRALKLEYEAQQAVLRLQSHVRDAQAFYEAGLIPKNDMLQSEVELAQGEQDLVDSENLTSMARARLNILMERPIESPLDVVDSTGYTLEKLDWDSVVNTAMENRAEIARSDRDVQIAENDIVLKKAPYLPTVALSASYERLGEEIGGGSPFPGTSSEIKTVKATATWKLWTWLQDRDEVMAARKNLKKAQKSVKKTENEIALDARNAFLRVEQAAKRIKVAEKTIEHARENFRINQEQYQAQLSTSTDVLDAQTLLTQAMTNYYDALYGYQLALAAVDKAKGVLGQKYSQ